MTLFALPLIGFGFANPWMLWFLLAAAAPLLLHLWHRRRQRETPWAAIELLLSAVRAQARRLRIQQWLLLAVRTLLIVLLVVATAEPFITRLGLPPAAGVRTHKVLVVDGSYSMAYGGPDDRRFARAKRLAARIVDEGRQGDGFTLVLMAATARPLVATPVFDRGSFTKQIDDLTLPHAGGDLIAALEAVDQILTRAQEEHPELQRSEVYFLTDLGRTSWQPGGAGGGERARREAILQSAVKRLADRATLVVLDVGPAGIENLAVTDLTTTAPFAPLSQDVPFDVVVRNFGDQAVTNRRIELWVDGAQAGQARIDLLPAGAAKTIPWSHRFTRLGSHIVEARCSGDPLDVDNHRWISISARPFLRVLCVAGKRGAADYLTLALNPDQSPSGAIRTETISDSQLVETDLTPYDAVILANVGEFTPGEAKLLNDYARQGGSMIFFLGDQVTAGRYNRVLAEPSQQDAKLLPAKLGRVVAQPQYGLDPLGYRHPIVEAFRGRAGSGLLTVPVYRYVRLTVPEQWRRSRVVAAFRNGDPAIVEAPVGRGCVVLVATAAALTSVDAATQMPWTALPVWPSFLPLVREMLAYAILPRQARDNVLVGQAFGAPHPSVAVPTFVQIDTPDGQQVRRRIERHGPEMVWSLTTTDQSGVYVVHIPPPHAEIRRFAVNVDTAESDLRPVAPERLPEGLLVRTDWQSERAAPAQPSGPHHGEQRWPLGAALGLLLGELALAWWLGREVVR